MTKNNALKDRLLAFGILGATLIAVGGTFASAATISTPTQAPHSVASSTADTHDAQWVTAGTSKGGLTGSQQGAGLGQ